MKRMLLTLVLALVSCAGAAPSAKVAATDVVNGAETAWMLSATACETFGDAAVKAKCSPILLTARGALVSAALDVDNGGTDYGCEIAQVVAAVKLVATLGVTLPSGVNAALTLASGVPCSPLEAGAASFSVSTGTLDAALALSATGSEAATVTITPPLAKDAGKD